MIRPTTLSLWSIKLLMNMPQKGFHIEVVHRDNRQGFKAGALEAALEKTPEEFIAIFDADFTPGSGFS